MNLREIESLLKDMSNGMDNKIDNINNKATSTQERIFALLIAEIDKFEIENGSYVTGQDYSKRFADIERKMNDIITKYYTPSVVEYLKHYNEIQDLTIKQQAEYNKIDVDKQLLNPTKQALYNQGSYYLTQGLADAYIQPAKFLMMQYVTKGSTVNDMRRALDRWDKGTLNTGELATDRHAPRLQAYATQIARDTMYTYQGAMQDVIKKEYGLTKFIYVGNLVKDSRPFCKHLVSLRRKIDLDEIPPLVIQYPQGLKPDTTKKNFALYRGGFSCGHSVMFVR